MNTFETFPRFMTSEDRQKNYANLALACQEFSLHLHKALSSARQKNVITSPLSVHVILSLLAQGAEGTTLEEMKQGLGLGRFAPTPEEFKSLMDVFNNAQRVELSLVNALYIQKGFELSSEFMELSKDIYDCVVSRVDFGQAIQAAKEINEWIGEQTKSKIKDIVSSDDFNFLTRLVLINAVYFKGKWLEPFQKILTRKETFHVTESNLKSVHTMSNKFSYPHGVLEDWDAKFLEIPYLDKDFSMIIVLPNKIDGLRSLEEKFSWDTLRTARRFFNDVVLYLPKFKIEAKIDLNVALNKLGFEQMFTDFADFSALANVPLLVNQVYQKIYIHVDEEGSEAAAATVVSMQFIGCAIRLPPPEIFRVDHPFLIAVQHKPSGVPLFFGSVINIP